MIPHSICWLTHTMRIVSWGSIDGKDWEEEDGTVTISHDGERLIYGGPYPESIEMMMDDMRAQPIAHGMSLRHFFDTLPNRLRNFTLAIPVLLDEEVTP